MLSITNINIKVNQNIIIENSSLELLDNKNYAIVAPNGSGKSTLFNAIFKHPSYEIEAKYNLGGNDISEYKTHEMIKAGLYLSLQNAPEIEGLKLSQFLFKMYKNVHGEISGLEFNNMINVYCDKYNIDKSFLNRDLNVGLSGGEKKQVDLLHLLLLKPKFAFLDEPDSGVDKDGVNRIANVINDMNNTTFVIISHGEALLSKIRIDKKLTIINKKIV